MGTKFRTMLAPIGLSTGDGRRFATGGISLDSVPMPFEWVRSREGGHDGAVQIGVVQSATIATVKDALAADLISADSVKGLDSKLEAVWASGEMYDDADRETMPRLAEDVAEAMHLMRGGTLGPSVDLDSFEGVPVIEGTDDPVTWEQIEQYYEENGEEPKLELLITEGRVRAATLVSIPAFAETSRPLELIEDAPAEGEAAADPATAAAESREHFAQLLASVGTEVRRFLAADFDMPALTGPTPITFDWDNGRVFGHIATWQTCHVGYSDVCVTAPKDESGGYSWFNRFPVETDGGTVWAGRLTVGGRHAGLELSASGAMSAYDGKTTAAYVRAYEDAYGIVLAGRIELAADSPERVILDRRKVSGDWRETPDGLSLVEVLALSPGPRAHAEPGFPVPGTFSRSGRQVALTAALGPVADEGLGTIALSLSTRDIDRVLDRREKREAERAAASAAREALSATLTAEQDALAAEARLVLAAALETNEEAS